MNAGTKWLLPFAVLSALLLTAIPGSADETVGTKIDNTIDKMSTKMRKTSRKAERKLRNATGNQSTVKDIDDAARDSMDEAKLSARKAKRSLK